MDDLFILERRRELQRFIEVEPRPETQGCEYCLKALPGSRLTTETRPHRAVQGLLERDAALAGDRLELGDDVGVERHRRSHGNIIGHMLMLS
ncbi:MAG TPA: hypothetical protein VMS64_31410 [Candidatus Methylomirabilis sp.]|nr:hypothetical protein [Candidatus Methylomirabilis sp.]